MSSLDSTELSVLPCGGGGLGGGGVGSGVASSGKEVNDRDGTSSGNTSRAKHSREGLNSFTYLAASVAPEWVGRPGGARSGGSGCLLSRSCSWRRRPLLQCRSSLLFCSLKC